MRETYSWEPALHSKLHTHTTNPLSRFMIFINTQMNDLLSSC